MPKGLHFRTLPGRFAIARTNEPARALDDIERAGAGWLARDASGWSAVVPWSKNKAEHVTSAEGPWTAFELAGPFPFTETGILLRCLAALADADVPILAVSTYDTDIVLVPELHNQTAIQSLLAKGLVQES